MQKLCKFEALSRPEIQCKCNKDFKIPRILDQENVTWIFAKKNLVNVVTRS